MKTIKLILGVLMLLFLSVSCDDSDDSDDQGVSNVPELEEGTVVLSLQLEKHAVNTALLALKREEKNIRIQLEQNPDNEDFQQQLDENLANQQIAQTRLNLVNSDLVALKIGPIPPPPPCADLPTDCPIGIDSLRQLLVSEIVKNFMARIIDRDTNELIYQFTNAEDSDIREDLIAWSLDVDLEQLPDTAVITIQQELGGEDRSFEVLVAFR